MNQSSPTKTDNFQVCDTRTSKHIVMNCCTNSTKFDGDKIVVVYQIKEQRNCKKQLQRLICPSKATSKLNTLHDTHSLQYTKSLFGTFAVQIFGHFLLYVYRIRDFGLIGQKVAKIKKAYRKHDCPLTNLSQDLSNNISES